MEGGWDASCPRGEGTAAEGGNIFGAPHVTAKQALGAGQNAKKAPEWVPSCL